YLTWLLWLCAVGFAAFVAWMILAPTGRQREKQEPIPHVTMSPSPLVSFSTMACLASIVFVPYAFQTDYVFLLPGYFLALGYWLCGERNGAIALIIWFLLYAGMMWLYLTGWSMDYFWIIPWIGLGTTVWLLRDRLVFPKKLTCNSA